MFLLSKRLFVEHAIRSQMGDRTPGEFLIDSPQWIYPHCCEKCCLSRCFSLTEPTQSLKYWFPRSEVPTSTGGRSMKKVGPLFRSWDGKKHSVPHEYLPAGTSRS